MNISRIAEGFSDASLSENLYSMDQRLVNILLFILIIHHFALFVKIKAEGVKNFPVRFAGCKSIFSAAVARLIILAGIVISIPPHGSGKKVSFIHTVASCGIPSHVTMTKFVRKMPNCVLIFSIICLIMYYVS